MKKAMKALFALLFLILTVSGALAAEKLNKPDIKIVDNYIAIFDMDTTGRVDKDVSRPLTDSIIHELSRSDKYDVIDRGNMNKILKEQKFQISGCVAQECKVEAGQLLGVGKIVSGSVGLVGETYYLILQLINVQTGKVELSAEDKCKCKIDDLIDSTKRLAKKLLSEQDVQLVATAPEPAIAAESKAEAITKAEATAKAKVKAEAEERAKAKAEAEKAARDKATARVKAESEAKAKADEVAKAEEIERTKASQIAKTKAEEIARAKIKQDELKATTSAINPELAITTVIAPDSRFEKLVSGVVRDTKNGLDWYAGPDKDTDWDDAKGWAAGLRVDGGGWRMPTLEELKGLYQKGVGSRNMTPLLKTNGWFVWSGETSGGWTLVLDFDDGRENSKSRYSSNYFRGFVVRSTTPESATTAIDTGAVSTKIISSDGRFQKLANGGVRDTKSGLDWYAGPDKDIGWDGAKQWTTGLRVDGGGWRMPTINELKGLYQKGAGSRNMTPLLETTGWWVWSGETTLGPGGGTGVLALDFDRGIEIMDRLDNSYFKRSFAVRSGK